MGKKLILTAPCLAMLAACGGSGTSNSPVGPTNPTVPAPVVLKSYTDGSGVVSANPNFGSAGGDSNLIVIASDVLAATEVAGGTINLSQVGSQTNNGSYYVNTRTGTASNGSTLQIVTAGESLNLSGSEYAAISIVTINSNSIGISSAGSEASQIPQGTYTYTGTASVLDLGSANIGDGSFSLTANFNSNTANIAATIPANSPQGNTNPAYFFSANGMQIDQSDGSFASSNGLIGATGVTSESASVNGYFAGSGATGVHGVAYSNAQNTPSYIGAFYGSK